MGMALSDEMIRAKAKEANLKKLQAYDKLQADLRKLVAKWLEKSNGMDYYDPVEFTDDLEKLLDGGE